MARVTYTYNPACGCQWCKNGGNRPANDGSGGHSWGYGNEHHPPSRSPWATTRPTSTA